MRILFVLMIVVCSVGSVASVSSASSSSSAPDLSVYLEQQLTMMDTSGVNALPKPASPVVETGLFYFLRRFWLRVRPKATFSLPGLVKIQVIPEVEMLFERPLPAGTTAYKR